MDKKNRGYAEEEYTEEVYFAEEERDDVNRPVSGPLRIAGRIALVLHIVAAMLIVFFAATSGYLPGKYLLIVAAVMIASVILALPFHLGKGTGSRIGGIVISLVFTAVMSIGIFYLVRIMSTINTITNDEFAEIDTMVVAVLANDEAQTLADAADYTFGISMTDGQEKTQSSVDHVTGEIGRSITTEEYASPMDQANALLRGEIRAIIYNKAYTPTLDEGITEYSDKIRILYSFDLTSEAKNINERQASVEEPFTVYISGIDVEGPITTTSRSDVNILVTVNPYTHQILQTSTPRDYYVPIPGVSGEERDKLTHAGIYGINTSIETIESIYDVQVDYYVRVNFTSVINIVDALGGIDVYVEEPYGDFHHGINHMDGETALAFSRERYSFATGDNQRGRDQEAVIAAIIDKLTSREVLLHADALMEVMAANMQTSMTREDITKLVSRQLAEGIQWNNESQVATGTGDSQTTFSMGDTRLYVMWPDEDVIAGLSARIKEVLAAR